MCHFLSCIVTQNDVLFHESSDSHEKSLTSMVLMTGPKNRILLG